MAVLLLAGSLAALAPGTASTATPMARTLKVGTVNIVITTFNPLKITLPDEYLVTHNVYSTLATYDGAYHVGPDLASSWSVTNGTVWTIHLVHNAYFTNPANPSDQSHPVTSADVVFSYQVEMANPSAVQHVYVQGISDVSALDSYTVRIVTPQPYAPMTAAFANVPILPVYIWSTVNPMTYAPPYPIGSGVLYYDPTNSSSNSLLVFHRSPNYYGATDYCRFSRPTTVEFIGYSSAAVMASDLAAGTSGLNAIDDLDAATYASSTLAPFPRVGVDGGFVGEFSINVMSTSERSGLVAKGLTQFSSGSNNQLLLVPAVRRGIAMSINKAALVKYALLGLGDVADSLVPGSDPWHFSIPSGQLYVFNTSAARSLLNAAGWQYDAAGNLNPGATPLYQAGGVNPLAFRFYTLNSAPEWQIAANNITAWLAQAGIQTLTASGTPGFSLFSIGQMSNAWFTGNYDMWLWNWLFNLGSDPSLNILFVETTMAIGPVSDNFFSNATYDGYYNLSLVTLDPTQRASLQNTMQGMVYAYASYILPYYRYNLYAYRTDAPSAASTAWTGWGNWSRSPGLAPDSDLPDLWMSVYPAAQSPPTIFSFPSVSGSASSATTISVTASDADGDALTYAWQFGDGTTATTTTGTTTHTYGAVGAYAVNVTVSDGEWPACGSATAYIGIAVNQPPSTPVIQGTSPLFTPPNATVSFTGNSTDPDPGETLMWTWNWSDGSTSVVKTTSAAKGVTASHAWLRPGTYLVLLTVSDGVFSVTSAPFTVDVTGVRVANAIGKPGQSVTIGALIIETTKGKWSFAFGDGSTASGSFGAGVTNLALVQTYAVQAIYTDTLTAKFGSSTATASGQVLIDGTPPTVIVHFASPIEATGILTTVNFTVNATDNFGLAGPATCNPAPGSLFPLGATKVVCQATDLAGNVGYGNATITLKDTTPPVLHTPGLVIVEATSAAGAPANFSVNATDAVGVASGPRCTPSSGSEFPLGSTTVHCTATDTSGNVGYGNFTVEVVDTTPPVIRILSVVDGNGFSVPYGGTTPSPSITFAFHATDAVGVVGYICSLDGEAFTSCFSPATYSSVGYGAHFVEVGAFDAAGNFGFARYNWTVLTPTATVQDLIAKVNALQAAGKLTSKQAGVLLAPLNKAYTDLQAGKVSLAIKELRTFEADVKQDVSGGVLSSADAQPLLNEACDLILVLGGTC